MIRKGKINGFLEMLITLCVESGHRDVRCPRKDFERTFEIQERAEVSVLYPEDEHWPMTEYLQEFGCPPTNGLNHVRYMLDGVDGYLVPVSARARIQRRKTMSAVMTTKLDDNKMLQLGEDHMGSKFEDLKQSFFGMFKSQGATLAGIMGTRQKQHRQLLDASGESSVASSTEPPPPAGGPFGTLTTGLNFFGLAPAPTLSSAAPAGKAAAPSTKVKADSAKAKMKAAPHRLL